MTSTGLYKHYKGNLYRVLFVAPWWSPGERVFPGLHVHVAPYDYDVGVRVLNRDAFLTAEWSGNEPSVLSLNAPIVIYVSLSGHGRVSARTLAEFEEQISYNAVTLTPTLRFERIGP